ncbi:hypothetical protein EON66_03070 [archaeon]|nr:MAG: hypothetical protein EON66_03070 [archaeon]
MAPRTFFPLLAQLHSGSAPVPASSALDALSTIPSHSLAALSSGDGVTAFTQAVLSFGKMGGSAPLQPMATVAPAPVGATRALWDGSTAGANKTSASAVSPASMTLHPSARINNTAVPAPHASPTSDFVSRAPPLVGRSTSSSHSSNSNGSYMHPNSVGSVAVGAVPVHYARAPSGVFPSAALSPPAAAAPDARGFDGGSAPQYGSRSVHVTGVVPAPAQPPQPPQHGQPPVGPFSAALHAASTTASSYSRTRMLPAGHHTGREPDATMVGGAAPTTHAAAGYAASSTVHTRIIPRSPEPPGVQSAVHASRAAARAANASMESGSVAHASFMGAPRAVSRSWREEADAEVEMEEAHQWTAAARTATPRRQRRSSSATAAPVEQSFVSQLDAEYAPMSPPSIARVTGGITPQFRRPSMTTDATASYAQSQPPRMGGEPVYDKVGQARLQQHPFFADALQPEHHSAPERVAACTEREQQWPAERTRSHATDMYQRAQYVPMDAQHARGAGGSLPHQTAAAGRQPANHEAAERHRFAPSEAAHFQSWDDRVSPTHNVDAYMHASEFRDAGGWSAPEGGRSASVSRATASRMRDIDISATVRAVQARVLAAGNVPLRPSHNDSDEEGGGALDRSGRRGPQRVQLLRTSGGGPRARGSTSVSDAWRSETSMQSSTPRRVHEGAYMHSYAFGGQESAAARTAPRRSVHSAVLPAAQAYRHLIRKPDVPSQSLQMKQRYAPTLIVRGDSADAPAAVVQPSLRPPPVPALGVAGSPPHRTVVPSEQPATTAQSAPIPHMRRGSAASTSTSVASGVNTSAYELEFGDWASLVFANQPPAPPAPSTPSRHALNSSAINASSSLPMWVSPAQSTARSASQMLGAAAGAPTSHRDVRTAGPPLSARAGAGASVSDMSSSATRRRHEVLSSVPDAEVAAGLAALDRGVMSPSLLYTSSSAQASGRAARFM